MNNKMISTKLVVCCKKKNNRMKLLYARYSIIVIEHKKIEIVNDALNNNNLQCSFCYGQ